MLYLIYYNVIQTQPDNTFYRMLIILCVPSVVPDFTTVRILSNQCFNNNP